jgi:hypothetical protein
VGHEALVSEGTECSKKQSLETYASSAHPASPDPEKNQSAYYDDLFSGAVR